LTKKATKHVIEELLEEVCNNKNKLAEILQQFNKTYNSIAEKIRGKVAE